MATGWWPRDGGEGDAEEHEPGRQTPEAKCGVQPFQKPSRAGIAPGLRDAGQGAAAGGAGCGRDARAAERAPPRGCGRLRYAYN
jgi:hypothetical protein